MHRRLSFFFFLLIMQVLKVISYRGKWYCKCQRLNALIFFAFSYIKRTKTFTRGSPPSIFLVYLIYSFHSKEGEEGNPYTCIHFPNFRYVHCSYPIRTHFNANNKNRKKTSGGEYFCKPLSLCTEGAKEKLHNRSRPKEQNKTGH